MPADGHIIYARSKHVSQHICTPAASVLADGYIIYVCSKCVSRHICTPTASVPANGHIIYACSKHVSQHICMPAETHGIDMRMRIWWGKTRMQSARRDL